MDSTKNYTPCSSCCANKELTFEDLKKKLFEKGYEAVSGFLGYDYSENEDRSITEERLDEAYAQMPNEEYERFLKMYCSCKGGASA